MSAADPKYEYEVAAAHYPDPLSLFEQDPDWKPYHLYHHRIAAASAVTLGACRPISLYFKRRPYYSGLHKTALWGLIGAVLGEIGQIGIDKYVKFRSQVHRHYIMLHPERFPPPKKEKIGDKFDLWQPSRN